MWRLITVYTLISFALSIKAQEPDIRRVCPNSTDNILYWNNPTYPCSNFTFYIIWERKGNTGPFTPVDTIRTEGATTYTHKDATPPLSQPNSNYFIERRDSCGPDYNHYSDTVFVDIVPPETSELDSVSVDINLNRVILGWRQNPSPDFDKYLLYVFINGFFNAMTPSETRDTFAFDLGGNNPSVASQSYNINTRDSCGKVPAFEKKHSTIFLQHTIDTCTKKYTLNWSHYVGWSKILKYYILLESDGGGYSLIDSVPGNQNTYSGNFKSGKTYNIFVRAIKDTTVLITSSSNKITFSSRARKDPSSLSINYVGFNTPNSENTILSFNTDIDNEVNGYRLIILNSSGNLISTFNLNTIQINQELNLGITNAEIYKYVVYSLDICNKTSYISDTSNNIILNKDGDFFNRKLSWNPYFTWNTGVEKYIIYRGSGSYGSFSFDPWKESFDLSINDSESVNDLNSAGICYYIQAVKSGEPSIVSKSNMICYPANLTIFVPNAFTPNGQNPYFKPSGLSIDYEKSIMQVFNRWGELVYENYISQGWDGLEKNGQICPPGVYYYQLQIISTKNEKVSKKGFVTLLR